MASCPTMEANERWFRGCAAYTVDKDSGSCEPAHTAVWPFPDLWNPDVLLPAQEAWDLFFPSRAII